MFLRRKLSTFNLELPLPVNLFIDLIELCVSDCYFSFNQVFYLQKSGMPMGSPISPVICNIFMEYFESELLPSIITNDFTWHRYVDDVFALVPNDIDLNQFLQRLNSLQQSIKFKIEVEQDSKLPFLDTLCIRDNINNKIKFTVFRKVTHSNSYIHSFSNHNINVKLATISNIFLRAYNICDPEYLDSEINYIFDTFRRLGYGEVTVKRSHFKARKTFYKSRGTKDKSSFKNVLVLPEIGDLPFIKRSIKNISGPDIKIVTRCNNNLKQIFKHNSHEKSNDCGVIYKIKCNDCSSAYIGESIDFNRRVNQHKNSFRNFDTNNAVVQHVLNSNHSVNINNAEVIYKENDTNKRKIIESILIQSIDNFNNQKCNFNCDIFTKQILIDNCPNIRKLLNDFNPITHNSSSVT